MSLRRRTSISVAAVAVVGLLGGAATYAAIQATDPAPNPASTSADASASMMDGQAMSMSMGMGRFDAEAPFDAQFLDQMTVHHEGALMSTRAMIADSARPELRDLANDIIASQSAQLDQMRTWRQQWYPEVATTFSMGAGMMGGAKDDGMMDGDMMGAGMMGGTGTDRMYLQMMIVHHQLAVDMAERAEEQATHPELRKLAATIAAEQSAEITRMRGYLGGRAASAEG